MRRYSKQPSSAIGLFWLGLALLFVYAFGLHGQSAGSAASTIASRRPLQQIRRIRFAADPSAARRNSAERPDQFNRTVGNESHVAPLLPARYLSRPLPPVTMPATLPPAPPLVAPSGHE